MLSIAAYRNYSGFIAKVTIHGCSSLSKLHKKHLYLNTDSPESRSFFLLLFPNTVKTVACPYLLSPPADRCVKIHSISHHSHHIAWTAQNYLSTEPDYQPLPCIPCRCLHKGKADTKGFQVYNDEMPYNNISDENTEDN